MSCGATNRQTAKTNMCAFVLNFKPLAKNGKTANKRALDLSDMRKVSHKYRKLTN